jgi:hypothetical protein
MPERPDDDRIGLVGCVKRKRSTATPACDLYTSPLFRGRRRYVEATCDLWFILSARHGLVEPETVLGPYDESLTNASLDRRRSWARSVLVDLDTRLGDHHGRTFEIHPGATYREHGLVDGLRQRGAVVVIPAVGLTQGQQLAFYAAGPTSKIPRTNTQQPVDPDPLRRSRLAPPDRRRAAISARASGGSYAPLGAHLAGLADDLVTLSFAQLEGILGRPLPASARRHRAWWSNERSGSHTHAWAWMANGWRVDAVDFTSGTMRFRRLTTRRVTSSGPTSR